MSRSRIAMLSLFIVVCPLISSPALAQQKRTTPPTRLFDAPGAPAFIRLDDKPGRNPPLDVSGNLLVGPEYQVAPERQLIEGVPKGRIQQFKIDSRQTKLFNPGIARKEFGKVDPDNPRTLIVETHQIDYERQITVYIPSQYKPGTKAPLMVIHDGPKGKPNLTIPRILGNLIHQKRVPPMIAIQVANGGGDAQGHERGKEYDTMWSHTPAFETELRLLWRLCEIRRVRF